MNQEDQEFLESLRKDFLDDTFDLLVKCEDSLLNFEKSFDEVFFQEYMRLIHSIKGSARAVEFDSIASTLHLIESLGQKSKDHTFIEMSLSSIDAIKDALQFVKDNDIPKMEATLAGIAQKLK